MIEGCINKKLYDTSKKHLNEVNDIGADKEGRETKGIEK